METVLNAFLTAIGAGLLTLIIMAIKWLIKKIRVDTITMQALAHDAYYRQTRHIVAKTTIREDELENHNYLYDAYKAQGLNSTGDKLHEMVLAKEVTVLSDDEDFASKLP